MTNVELPTPVNGVPYFPAGTYVACDPAQILSPIAWNHVVFTLMSHSSSVAFRYKGHLVFMWTTLGGDGVFPLYEDKRFCANVSTDNCLLCLAPIALLNVPNGITLACDNDVGIYSSEIAIPYITTPGNAKHGAFEVITSRKIGDDYDTQPVDYDDISSAGTTTPLAAYAFSDADDDNSSFFDENCPPLINVDED